MAVLVLKGVYVALAVTCDVFRVSTAVPMVWDNWPLVVSLAVAGAPERILSICELCALIKPGQRE